MKYYTPMCPECAVVLEIDDHYDLCDVGSLVIMVKTSGHCACCGKNYTWKDVYSLSRFQDLKEN